MFAMGTSPRAFSTSRSPLVACLLLVLAHVSYAGGNGSHTMTMQRDFIKSPFFYDCDGCNGRKELHGTSTNAEVGNSQYQEDIDIVATYSDTSGAVRLGRVRLKDLSSSWVWENQIDGNHGRPRNFAVSSLNNLSTQTTPSNQSEIRCEGGVHRHSSPSSPVKLKRWMIRQEKRERRTAELIREDKERDEQLVTAAIEKAKSLDTTRKRKYSIWRRDYENPNSDSTLRLMRDQVIMAKAYATIARSKNGYDLYSSLMAHSKKNQQVFGEATTDTDLNPSALDQAKAMGHMLSLAKDQLYDCLANARKLRAMLQSTEEHVNAARRKSAFLIQLAAKTVPRQLHCLSLQLATDYYSLQGREIMEVANKEKIEDPSLYHYAMFSDNALATSVVVNSTMQHAEEPEKHVFHIVTDKLNFAAMEMWFLVNSPAKATIHVENIDSFKWLNSSYCSVLRQLKSARIKEYYFKANQASSLSAGADHLKYRNPKYLSMLNHLRFYLPEVYPKLDKILFLDDDIVVQKDLTPLWSVDLHGMVNGAVETCKESFHRFDKYLNFSNPKISNNFDPNACGWAFGMNIFDLKEWKHHRNLSSLARHE